MEPQWASPHGLLNRRSPWLFPFLQWMKLGCQVLLLGHFGPLYLPQVSKLMMKNVAFKSNLALSC